MIVPTDINTFDLVKLHQSPIMLQTNEIIYEVEYAAQEGYNPLLDSDEQQLEEDQEDDKLQFSLVTNEMKHASQEAISKQTIQAYSKYCALLHLPCIFTYQMCCRLWQDFRTHVAQNVGTDEAKSLDEHSHHIPVYICTWIYLECDIPDIQNNLKTRCVNKTYSQALKMQAAISFHYNELGRVTDSWHQSKDESWMWNPSLSKDVSCYMLSLQRRKVPLPLELLLSSGGRWH